MKRPRLLLADDHTLVLEGFQKMLEGECELVGAVEDGRALMSEAERLHPDIILLDISMPLLNGIDAARRIKKILPKVKLVFLTMHADPAYVTEAFRAGASAYVLKRSAASELTRAIHEVLKGRSYVTPLVTKDVLQSALEPASSHQHKTFSNTLTARQREVLQLVAEGHSLKEIASLLHVSIKTVEFHKARIMQTLGIRSTAALTKYAITQGIVSL